MAAKQTKEPKNKNTKKSPEEKTSNEDSSQKTAPQLKLRRSDTDRVIAGVSGGLGKFFNIDSTVIRLIFVLLTVFGGGGILLYFVLWLIMPSSVSTSYTTEETIDENKKEIREKAKQAAENIKYSDEKNNGGSRDTLAIILIILGVYFLLSNLGFLRHIDLFRYWPVILIIIGISILMKDG